MIHLLGCDRVYFLGYFVELAFTCFSSLFCQIAKSTFAVFFSFLAILSRWFLSLCETHVAKFYIPKSPTPHSQNIAQLSKYISSYELPIRASSCAQLYFFFWVAQRLMKKNSLCWIFCPKKTQIDLRKFHVLDGILEQGDWFPKW